MHLSSLVGGWLMLGLAIGSPNPSTDVQPTSTTGSFSFPLYPSLSYATPRPKWSSIPSYAKPFASFSHLVANQSTTTWASIASPTDSNAKYGNVAWSSLWSGFNVTAPPFTTTRSATPVPRSELIQPTPLPFTPLVEPGTHYAFPKDFTWGFASAALQVEGAVNMEGRTPTIIEQLANQPNSLLGSGKPDISNLNYYLYKQDIARLAALGVQSYSFSISWSRILPFVVPGSPVNKQAIDHYDDLINTIIEYGMVPIATLNHFDTPLYYQTNTSWQGWDHPEFLEGFLNYAQIVLTHYSDRVGTWITFNEPTTDGMRVHNWASGYNIVMGHAQVSNWYRKNIGGTGRFSLKFSFGGGGFPLPLDPSNPADVDATNRYLDFAIGYIAHPLFLGLPPPDSVTSALGPKAPKFTPAELAFAKGTCDFFAFDFYSPGYQSSPSGGITACSQNSSNPAFPVCVNSQFTRAGWEIGAIGDSGTVAYEYVRTTLAFLLGRYPTKGGIMITEAGLAPSGASEMSIPQLQSDLTQSILYVSTLTEILKAIHEDKNRMIGFIGWTSVDNWEWGSYGPHYGVQGFNSTTLERYYKRSIFDFSNFMIKHGAK